jgi:crossover junction endodeoxyribonuclease RuvC
VIVLGIDPGLAETGWGFVAVHGNQLAHIAHGTIRTAAGLPLELRLKMIYQTLIELISLHKPNCASVEILFFSRNVQSALPVAHARGAVYLTLAIASVPVFEYTPNIIKLAVCGNGRAEKPQVQEMVRLLLGLLQIPKPNHAADALAAAICHIHTGGGFPLVS